VQRFLRGDDDYRNARLKIIPSLVDGPMPIRMAAPAKRERPVHNPDLIPVSWRKLQNDGHKNPHLEATLDCLSGKAIRSAASLVKRFLVKLSIDVAIVLSRPEDQTEPEPSA